MSQTNIFSDDKFNEILCSWKEDFDTPNPFLSENIIQSQSNISTNHFPVQFSKLSFATILVLGLITGYIFYIITENSYQNNENSISSEANLMSKYKSEIFISELKYSEIENLLSEK